MRLVVIKHLAISLLICILTFSYMLFISIPVSIFQHDTNLMVQKGQINTSKIDSFINPLTKEPNLKAELNLTACDLVKRRRPLDTSRIINPHPYANIVAPHTDCELSVFLVVYVHSAYAHYQRRALIRRTWGNAVQFGKFVRLVFITGIEPVNKIKKSDLLEKEIKTYGDIIQCNFWDTYRNLVKKSICGLKWIMEHCRSAKYVLKTDDDAFVNMYLLLQHIRIGTKSGLYGNNVLLCNFYGTQVQRKGKWKTTYEECSLKQYPTYCQGLAFAMTIDVAILLFNASHYVPLLWMDDVYITGMLPALLPVGAVQHINGGSFYMSSSEVKKSTVKKVLKSPNVFKFLYYHVENTAIFENAWNVLSFHARTGVFQQYVETMNSKNSQSERMALKLSRSTNVLKKAKVLQKIPMLR